MRVRRVDPSDGDDVRAFVNLPFLLYRDCRQWVPPLVNDVKGVMDRRRHPFYQHSDAEFFVAEEAGQAVGRIAMLENRNFNAYNHCRAALFFYFDCVDDKLAARSLFDAAFGWMRERGLNQVIGPKGFHPTDGLGLLVEGFEHRPAMGIPYNYAYYSSLLHQAWRPAVRLFERSDRAAGTLLCARREGQGPTRPEDTQVLEQGGDAPVAQARCGGAE